MTIGASVGRGGDNRSEDALEVQRLLNGCLHAQPAYVPLRVDGLVGPDTIAAIELFQRSIVNEAQPDGRVDPGGPTYRSLIANAADDGSGPDSGSSAAGATPATGGAPGEGGVTVAQLRAIMTTLAADKAAAYVPPLNRAQVEAQITTVLRVAAFLAQLAHESVELRYFEEIASGDAYEGRRDLGNTEPGDGRRYKGRGPIQLTGRLNYRSAGSALGLDLEGHPELAATPEVGFRVAGWFWTTRRLNAKADAGDFDAITRAINGGLNGKASRDHYYAVAKQVLGLPVT